MNTPAPAAHHPLRIGVTPGHFQSLDLSPPRVFAMGLTYASHCAETGEPPQRVIFEKHCTPTTNADVLVPTANALFESLQVLDPTLAQWLLVNRMLNTALVDYEVELGIALLEDVSRAQLYQADHPLKVGFFLANDVTARTVQICGEGIPNRLDYWSAAKSFAGFLPVSAQMWVPDASTAGILATTVETSVNGQLRQSASTLDLMFTVPQMLAIACEQFNLNHLVRGTWLLTGTPGGIALNATARQRRLLALLPRRLAIRLALFANRRKKSFLSVGDTVTCSGGNGLTIASAIRDTGG